MQVSIITITQLSRHKYLLILLELLEKQSYKNILEWIIVEGSKDINNAEKNNNLINQLKARFKIKYIPFSENATINILRNKGNSNCEGDIIINLDDDDYIFNNCIDYCVSKLKGDKLIGMSQVSYIHDININKTFKISGYNFFCYKKEYLNKNKHDETEYNDEYKSITNNYTPDNLEYLISDNLIIKIIHRNNHFYNKVITLGGSMMNLNNINRLEDRVIDYLMPNDYYKKYKALVDDSILDYDIVYYTGGFGIVWDPEDKKLGGSEQAIVNLSENWAKMNKKVIVYGNFSYDKTINNVDYKFWTKFPFERKIKTLIAWRKNGLMPLMYNNFKAEKLILDFHDNFSYTLMDLDNDKLKDLFKKVNKFNFKSNYHKISFEEFLRVKFNNDIIIAEDKYNIILNGIRIESFSNKDIFKEDLHRNPYRLCYCSSYDRGLETILTKIFPIIYKAEPRAELHVYYGMDYIYDEEFKNKIKKLLSQAGVMEHGRQSMEMIIREKYLSTFHLYLSESVAEIDCINIRESLISGCIPIISKFGVFAERHGFQYDFNSNDNKRCEAIAYDILSKMKEPDQLEFARKALLNSNTIINWEDVAKKWLESF